METPETVQGTVQDRTGYTQTDDVIAQRNPRLCRIFSWLFDQKLKKNFHAIRVLSKPPEIEGPLICYLNHPSWNDPMVISFLTHHFFPSREAYGPMDADAIEEYGFFKKVGLYGVSSGNAGGARKFLRTSLAILARPDTAIWITPQGKFSDIRERPVKLEPGLGALLKAAKIPITTLPIAVEYGFGVEQCPEIFVSFGEPVSASDGNWTSACEQALEKTQDHLAKHVITKNFDVFQTILGGSVGVGGVYGFTQRIKAALQGKKYDPSHESITS